MARTRYALAMALICATFALNAADAEITCVVSGNGNVRALDGKRTIASAHPGLFVEEWQYRDLGGARPSEDAPPGGPYASVATLPNEGGAIAITVSVSPTGSGLELTYSLTPDRAIRYNSVHAGIELPLGRWSGAEWAAGDRSGTVPQTRGPVSIFGGPADALELTSSAGSVLSVRAPMGHSFTLQDNREWNGELEVRVGEGGTPAREWPAGQEKVIVMALEFGEPVSVEYDGPVVLEASDRWIELNGGLDIEPGSALDWSDQGMVNWAEGATSRIIAGESGHFEYADRPGEPVRFYGVNVCFSALYPEHEGADILARRLRMLGYNALRIHHHESSLVDNSRADSVTLNMENLDRLEYLIAALKREGIYITTDVYVSRGVRAGEIFPDAGGNIAMDDFKMLVAVSDAAFENLCEFARRFFGHVNPYTGMALKDDPVLMSLVLVNEDNYLNFIGGMEPLVRQLWVQAYNEWLREQYGNRSALAEAWGDALKAEEDPARGTVGLDRTGGRRGLDLELFCADMHTRTFAKMRDFVRNELGSKVLLTAMNGWTETLAHQVVRADFDLVDTHFYWDHPNFLERAWSLPSRGWSQGGSAPTLHGAGARDQALVRLLGKPFTISEFNYTAPNAYRAEGGLLMGAAAALQAWDGVYRFAYSHSVGNLLELSAMNYFDLATDPLTLASDRLAALLFLRGDMASARHTVAVSIDPDALRDGAGRMPDLRTDLSRLAYITGIGSQLGEGPADIALAANDGAGPSAYDPRAVERTIEALRERGALSAGNPTDPDAGLLCSETGEVTIDSDAGTIAISTPRTAAVFARDPGTTVMAGVLAVTLEESGGAVWVTSLDGEPIPTSSRLLVAHLTDLKNTGMRFAERDMVTLEAWGTTPHLARAGRASITLARPAGALRASCLDLSGRPVGVAELSGTAESMTLTADVRGPEGACLYYELSP